MPAARRFDVCNGDADGLCAVVQWRLHDPGPATLVTGLKREIALLERVPAAAGDEVLVCDLSMQRNRAALMRLLDAGVRVRYFDHHAVDGIPQHSRLDAHIEFGSEVCTSLLVDRHLGGRYQRWALVGAYGDNLTAVAERLAIEAGIAGDERARLRRLGESINYNAYGDDESDVAIAPARLFEILERYRDPLELQAHEPIARRLDEQRRNDLAQAASVPVHWQDEGASVLLLPDAPWSRRVIGCLANERAQAEPNRAHAVLKRQAAGALVVSVRAPLAAPNGANDLCRRFGGGGRAAAAGIDALPEADLDAFVTALAQQRWGAL